MGLNPLDNDNPHSDNSQTLAKFDWPKLRKAIEFYESEHLCYLPAGWGHKNPSVAWEEYQTRLPTMAEKADWFHEGKPTNIGVLCGGVSRGLVTLCFNDPTGAPEFFGEERWQKLPQATFVTQAIRGPHVWLRSDTPIKSQFIPKGKNKSWLEIRSDGNFTVAPPSLHPDGVLYEAIGVDHIYKPEDLAGFIDKRLAELGLTAWEAPRGRAKPSAKGRLPKRSDEFNTLAIQKLLEHCLFVQHCRDDAATLPEPHWWSMVHILVVFGEPGREKIHELSQPYPSYSEGETEQKIAEALKAGDKEIGPHTCLFIEQGLGFTCPGECLAKKLGVKSPVGLAEELPRILTTNRFLKEKTANTIDAVKQANNPPRIFERGGGIVRVNKDERQIPYIEVLSESGLRGFIERSARYVRMNEKGDIIPLSPPLDIVRDYMTLPAQQRCLPPLLAITEIPVMRPDGSMVTSPGYDPITMLYFEPTPELVVPEVPEDPTRTQLQAAVDLIKEPLQDFPFDSEASRTNAIAAMVTAIYRPMITGPAPMCVIDKPQAGTGASLISEVIATITTGRPAAMMGAAWDDEEWEKKLTAVLRRGRFIIVVDNVDGVLYSPSLARFLSSFNVHCRILGQTEDIILPNRATYICTGNNVRLAGDLPRRCYLSRLDALDARPWLRDLKSFKHERLIQWVKWNRGVILAAIMTLARAWMAAGRPKPTDLPNLGGFEDWVDTVGGILGYAGITGFLQNLEQMYSKADIDTAQWELFLAAWQDVFHDTCVTVSEVITALDLYSKDRTGDNDFATALPEGVDRDQKKINRSLGNALGKRAGVRYPNRLMVVKAGEKKHAATWKVVSYETPKTPNLASKGELGESSSTPNQFQPSPPPGVGVGANSPNSPPDTKSGVFAKPNSPDKPKLLLSDGRVVDWNWCLTTWDKIGRPIIHAGDNDNIFDLSLFLYPEKVSPKRLEGIVNWLEEHSGENMADRRDFEP